MDIQTPLKIIPDSSGVKPGMTRKTWWVNEKSSLVQL